MKPFPELMHGVIIPTRTRPVTSGGPAIMMSRQEYEVDDRGAFSGWKREELHL